MKGRQKLEALVLSSRKSGEADRFVTLFTREYGLLKAVAKGVRRIPSRRGGHLEPLSHVLALLTMTRAGNFVGAIETIDHFPRLHERADSLYVARMGALTIESFFAEGQAEDELYDALLHSWQIASDLTPPQLGMLEVALFVLTLRRAGLVPDLSACGVCNKQQPEESVLLDAHLGGWKCLTCHHGLAGTDASLAPALLKVLRFVHMYPGRALKVQMSIVFVTQLVRAVRQYVAQVSDNTVLHRQIMQVGPISL